MGEPVADKTFLASIRSEFDKKRFGFEITEQEISSIGHSNFLNLSVFLLLRFAIFLYIAALWVWSVVDYFLDKNEEYFLIYLTNLTLTLQAIYFLLAFITTAKSKMCQGSSENINGTDSPSSFAVLTWIMQDVTYSTSFAVTLLYFVFLYTKSASPLTIQVHSVNFIATFIDNAFAEEFPVRLLHTCIPMLYGLLYVLWSIIHFFTEVGTDLNTEYIYEQLDWNDPFSSAIFSLAVIFVLLPILNAILFLEKIAVVSLRDKFFERDLNGYNERIISNGIA
mmetsp:Transcript_4094/g.6246  ORF Transcript_4094/g.6246 Transcript_4094/m.6246 type:complete len:280 (-) Transcript_4094:27-866(-)